MIYDAPFGARSVTKRCPVCRTEYEDWVRVCSDCGVDMTSGGFQDAEEETYSGGPSLSIEFTLLSGETISVREMLEEAPTEESVKAYADALIREMGTETVRT